MASSAAGVARALGRSPHFLIGLGNDLRGSPDWNHDLDGAYTLGTTLDLHYAYLTGLPGQGGWEDWNEGGSFVNLLTDSARRHGVTPMFTLYTMAAWGENNLGVAKQSDYMDLYWKGMRLFYQRIALFGRPVLVHLEPDFWAFAQRTYPDPRKMEVRVKSNADCRDLPDDLTGMGRCLIRMARHYAPKAVVGFHASSWASGSAASVANYLLSIGAAESDLVVLDVLDRDAGCFEAKASECTRSGGGWYWDESNRTSPNFHEHLAWARELSSTAHKPLLWWQLPLGVPSATPGGAPGHYRDNRVHYLFRHVQEFVDAGGVGAVFGTGAGNQTYIDSDGGQFRNAARAYFASPLPLR